MVKHTQAICRQFHSNVPFLYSLKMSENLYFLTFSGGIEMQHWTEIGEDSSS